MADQAKVTSIDALEAFRASLIIFLDQAHRTVDEVGDEVRRTRQWLQQDRRLYWANEVRRRGRVLDAAEQELMSARLSGLRDNTTVQEEAVRKAKIAVREGEEKLRKVKLWSRDFDHAVEPVARRMERLRNYLDGDLPKALSFLLQAQRTLEAYAEMAPPPAHPVLPAGPSPSAEA